MIKRTTRTNNFTIINNRVLERADLSLKAKGLWAFVMTKPDGWQTSIRGLKAQLQEGDASIRSALKELENVGLYRKTKSRNELGQVTWTDEMFDEPCMENPHMDKPRVEKSRQVNTKQVRTEEVSTDKATAVAVAADARGVERYGNADINEVFDLWESVVGYKIEGGKQKNRYAASNLLKKHGREGVERILRGVEMASHDQYAPRISDFVSLQARYNDLVAWGRRQSNAAPKVVSI